MQHTFHLLLLLLLLLAANILILKHVWNQTYGKVFTKSLQKLSHILHLTQIIFSLIHVKLLLNNNTIRFLYLFIYAHICYIIVHQIVLLHLLFFLSPSFVFSQILAGFIISHVCCNIFFNLGLPVIQTFSDNNQWTNIQEPKK